MEPNAPTPLNADEFASLRKLSLTPSMLDIPHVFTFRDGKIAFKHFVHKATKPSLIALNRAIRARPRRAFSMF
jgi:hypothetical protein